MAGLFGGGSKGPSMSERFMQAQQEAARATADAQARSEAANRQAESEAAFRKQMAENSAADAKRLAELEDEKKRYGGAMAGAPTLSRGTFLLSNDSTQRGLVL